MPQRVEASSVGRRFARRQIDEPLSSTPAAAGRCAHRFARSPPSGPAGRPRPSGPIPQALTNGDQEPTAALCNPSSPWPSWFWGWPACSPPRPVAVLEATGVTRVRAARLEREGAGRAETRQRGERGRAGAASPRVEPLPRAVPRGTEGWAVAGRAEAAGQPQAARAGGVAREEAEVRRPRAARRQPAGRPRQVARWPPVEPIAPVGSTGVAEARGRAAPLPQAAPARRRAEPEAAREERPRRIRATASP